MCDMCMCDICMCDMCMYDMCMCGMCICDTCMCDMCVRSMCVDINLSTRVTDRIPHASHILLQFEDLRANIQIRNH